jgi:hypothetical protein
LKKTRVIIPKCIITRKKFYCQDPWVLTQTKSFDILFENTLEEKVKSSNKQKNISENYFYQITAVKNYTCNFRLLWMYIC